MSNVVSLPTAPNPDAAWSRYQSFAKRLIDDPRLALNRGFMEQMHLAETAWKRAFDFEFQRSQSKGSGQ